MTDYVPSEWNVDGWRIRLENGQKGPNDVRIWVASPGGDYSLMKLSSLGAVIHLWYDNEDRLYPPPALGGLKVLSFLQACCELGLTRACRLHQLRSPVIERIDSGRAA